MNGTFDEFDEGQNTQTLSKNIYKFQQQEDLLLLCLLWTFKFQHFVLNRVGSRYCKSSLITTKQNKPSFVSFLVFAFEARLKTLGA